MKYAKRALAIMIPEITKRELFYQITMRSSTGINISPSTTLKAL